jgi:hypothetical protein
MPNMTPALYEKNITLRCLLEEAYRSAFYINFALVNAGLTITQIPLSLFLANMQEEEEEQYSTSYISTMLSILNTITFCFIGMAAANMITSVQKFGLPLPKLKPIFKEILSNRSTLIENEHILDEYIKEAEAIKATQSSWIRVLFTIRSVMGAMMLHNNTFVAKAPSLGLNFMDTALGVTNYYTNYNKPEDLAKNTIFRMDEKFIAKFNEIFKNEFKAKDMKFIANSSIAMANKEISAIYIVKIILDFTSKKDQNDIIKSLWKLRAVGEAGSIAFNEEGAYVAYLNLDMSPHLGWVSAESIKTNFLVALSKKFETVDTKANSAWKTKERLLNLIRQYYFGCEIKHGFECDVALDEFIFDQISDERLFKNLQALQENYPNIVKQSETGFILSLSECAKSKDIINKLGNMMQPEPVKFVKENENSGAPSVQNAEVEQKVSSWKRYRDASLIENDEPEAKKELGLQQDIKWENEDYNRIDLKDIIAIENFAQLQPLTGTMNYIYYSPAFKNEYANNGRVKEQIDKYKEMIAHDDSGNGIKELRRNGKLLAYYTSDGKSDTRIVFKAVTKAKVPSMRDIHKMKTVILLEPYKVCNHEQLRTMDFNHPDLKQSLEILSRKENVTASAGGSSSSKYH